MVIHFRVEEGVPSLTTWESKVQNITGEDEDVCTWGGEGYGRMLLGKHKPVTAMLGWESRKLDYHDFFLFYHKINYVSQEYTYNRNKER